ncbi:iron-containing redox enzyme family protein [Streptosporangium sp. NPDC006013]|uniref:iron-containing redox enzyme family protein n=1 Tax=Streptosporangium sp. NPDC006013 TaxID=3155596 RepID=UPI00339F6072
MARGFDASAHYGRRIADVHDGGITVNDSPGGTCRPLTASGFPADPDLSASPEPPRSPGPPRLSDLPESSALSRLPELLGSPGPGPSRATKPPGSPKAPRSLKPAKSPERSKLAERPDPLDLPVPGRAPALPAARGPISALLFERLVHPPHRFGLLSLPLLSFPARFAGPVLADEDVQLALFVCYELHHRGFEGVDERWEWNPSLLEVREILEARFEEGLARAVSCPPTQRAEQMSQALTDLVAAAVDGPDLPGFLQRQADLAQFREFVAHRSIHHLKGADQRTWAIPRLSGRPKAALVEIQAGQYGGGRVERMHSELFRTTMRRLGMDDSYGAYLDQVPAITLAVSNTMSLFGLHRRHLGALLGHLAAAEMTSSVPNRRYSESLRRLGAGEAASRFYDEQVRADAVPEQTAAHDMCGGFARQHPSRAGDVLYGAACALTLDRLFAEHVMSRWRRGVSSLREVGAARP